MEDQSIKDSLIDPRDSSAINGYEAEPLTVIESIKVGGGTEEVATKAKKALDNNDSNIVSCIARYNRVISHYNNPINTINSILLEPLSESAFLNWILRIFLKKDYRIGLSLFLLVCSGLNILFFLLVLVGFALYLLRVRKFMQNEDRVVDPFMKMIFSQEICESLNVHFHYFKINVNCKQLFKREIWLSFFNHFLNLHRNG